MWAEDTKASQGADALLAALEAGSHVAKIIDNDTLYSDVVLMIGVMRWFGEVNGVHATSEPVDPVVSKRLVGEAMRFFQACEVHAEEAKTRLKSVATSPLFDVKGTLLVRLNDSAVREGKDLADRIVIEFAKTCPTIGRTALEALELETHTQLEKHANWKAGLPHVSLRVRMFVCVCLLIVVVSCVWCPVCSFNCGGRGGSLPVGCEVGLRLRRSALPVDVPVHAPSLSGGEVLGTVGAPQVPSRTQGSTKASEGPG